MANDTLPEKPPTDQQKIPTFPAIVADVIVGIFEERPISSRDGLIRQIALIIEQVMDLSASDVQHHNNLKNRFKMFIVAAGGGAICGYLASWIINF